MAEQSKPDEVMADGREAFDAVIVPVCDTLAARGFRGSSIYAIGSALKYLARLGAKGTETAATDISKAIRYLEMARCQIEPSAATPAAAESPLPPPSACHADIEAARVAERLLPFPQAVQPRKVAWSEVPGGAIVAIPDAPDGPAVAVRWSCGGGMWVGASCTPLDPGPWRLWEHMGLTHDAWIVAEGLQNWQLRTWIVESRKLVAGGNGK